MFVGWGLGEARGSLALPRTCTPLHERYAPVGEALPEPGHTGFPGDLRSISASMHQKAAFQLNARACGRWSSTVYSPER